MARYICTVAQKSGKVSEWSTLTQELDQMNSERKAEFELLKRKRQGLSKQKDQEAVKAKQDILKRLLAKKQRQK